jgi:hypothetical protein
LREGKKKGEGGELLRWRKERKKGLNRFHPAAWDPPVRDTGGQSATPPRTVREARGRSGHQARTVRYCFQNDQRRTSFPRATRTVRAALADSPPGAAGRSALLMRTVRPPF